MHSARQPRDEGAWPDRVARPDLDPLHVDQAATGWVAATGPRSRSMRRSTMASDNFTVQVGNLTDDPELRFTRNGTP